MRGFEPENAEAFEHHLKSEKIMNGEEESHNGGSTVSEDICNNNAMRIRVWQWAELGSKLPGSPGLILSQKPVVNLCPSLCLAWTMRFFLSSMEA